MKSSEACKAWAPRGITKSRCVRLPKKACTLQPWFARMGIQPHQKMGIQSHEKLSIYKIRATEPTTESDLPSVSASLAYPIGDFWGWVEPINPAVYCLSEKLEVRLASRKCYTKPEWVSNPIQKWVSNPIKSRRFPKNAIGYPIPNLPRRCYGGLPL